jgi:dTDP-4-amino-4,6-dideoxygalactose transaminase
MNTKIWLSSPHMSGGEQKYVQEAFDTNWIAPLGPNVNGLEEDLERYLGEQIHVAVLSSGTAAIHLALIILGIKAGDYVVCQSMTFSASANPIIYQGAKPIFIDSEVETWNMCPIALEDAIKDNIIKGKKPKAIIAVHLYGMPYKVIEIRNIADKYQIPVIEDSAEALGSIYGGQKCGTFGDMGILSFNGNKIITTSGGGAIVTRDKAIKDKAVFLSTQARDVAAHYQHSEIGYNYRMSNVCAGIGRGQMEVLDKHVNLRREMNNIYKDYFSRKCGVSLLTSPSDDYFSNHWLTVVTMNPAQNGGKSSESLRRWLEKENIESRPLWKPMHLQPIFQKYQYYGKQVCENLFYNGLCLPSGSNLQESDKQRIFAALDSFFAA